MGVLEQGQVLVGEDWKRDVESRLEEHSNRLLAGNERFERTEKRIGEVADAVDANTAITEKTAKNVEKLVDIFQAFDGFVRVGGWLGNTVKWVAGVLICGAVIYWFVKTGDLPKKP